MPERKRSGDYADCPEVKKQVYQELAVPLTLDFDEYDNPYSSKNLNGSMLSTYALFELIDPISTFTTKYSATSASFSKSYKTLLYSIDDFADADSRAVVASAIKKLDIDSYVGLGPGAEKFYLVEATPYQWLHNKSSDVSFTVGPPESASDFVEIGASSVRTVEFTGFSIMITLPWYDARVFTTRGWTLNGYSIGEVSAGDYTNGGLIPFVPVQLVVSTSGGYKRLIGVVSDILPKAPMQVAYQESKPTAMPMRNRSLASPSITRNRASILVNKLDNPIPIE